MPSEVFQVFELCHTLQAENLSVHAERGILENRQHLNFFMLYELAYKHKS
jgi:hypothetical protein